MICTQNHTRICKFTSFLNIPRANLYSFPAVSSSFFSNGFHFWCLNVFDTDKHGWAGKKMWTWQCRNSWLRSNSQNQPHLHLVSVAHLCLALFVSMSVCLWLSEVALQPQLCCWDCGLGGKRKSWQASTILCMCTLVPPPQDHYRADSGYKWRQKHKMVPPVSGVFWKQSIASMCYG